MEDSGPPGPKLLIPGLKEYRMQTIRQELCGTAWKWVLSGAFVRQQKLLCSRGRKKRWKSFSFICNVFWVPCSLYLHTHSLSAYKPMWGRTNKQTRQLISQGADAHWRFGIVPCSLFHSYLLSSKRKRGAM